MNAADYLSRSDDDVDFQKAWKILRDMMNDDYYKADVLQAMEKRACISCSTLWRLGGIGAIHVYYVGKVE